ncbi:MAG TPA: TIGR00282 family metallophosphoesterase [Firmicutes bacterium]|nr:TIGR00282 family metallophosphoesterase [Bacillota bacterium]
MRILFLGDIVGRPGRSVLENNLRRIQDEEKIDFTIANGENSSGGFGMNKKGYDAMIMSGIDVFTMGNHTFDNKRIVDFIDDADIVRPLNLTMSAPGKGIRSYPLPDGRKITIINLLGRVYSHLNVDCPFKTMESVLKDHSLKEEILFVDIHADATSEKVCLGHFLDGRVSVVAGTHTHIQTADERILSRGTAYITDVGMTGAYDSSLGMDKEAAISRFTSVLGGKMVPALGERQINGIIVEINDQNKAISMHRIFQVYPEEI